MGPESPAHVVPCALPAGSLLAGYRDAGHYADCYCARIGRPVTLAAFVEAFYTTWLFRIERWILRVAVAKPSTDEDARRVARGESGRFAAWTVEDRRPEELLMCDYQGRTRSWFMVAPDGGGTLLRFGSAVTAPPDPRSGRRRMSFPFRALIGFHRLYSRNLLAAARSRLA